MKKEKKNENRFDAFAWLVVIQQHVLYNFFFPHYSKMQLRVFG